MALFGRKRNDEPLTSMAQRALAERGIETTVDGPADAPEHVKLLGADGQVYPLANLAMLVDGESAKTRAAIVADHFDRMVRAHAEPAPEQIPADELRDRIRMRLVAEKDDDPADLSYGRPFAPGIIGVLCVDNPLTVTTLSAGMLPKMSLGVDEMFALGQANTDAEPVDERSEVAPGVHLAGGSSLFVASKAANLPAVFGSAPYGTVIAMPHRHILLAAPILDGSSITAVNALGQMMLGMLANPEFQVPGGLISPYLYFARGGEVSQVSAFAEDGTMQIEVDERFQQALEQAMGTTA
jgi:hypothetical protein